MKKFVLSLVALVLVASAPVWANLADRLTWIDNIPGLRVIKFEQSMHEVEKDYAMTNPKKEYDMVLKGLKKAGWQTVVSDYDHGLGIPEITAIKDGMKFEMEVDRDRDDFTGKVRYKLEVQLKTYEQWDD